MIDHILTQNADIITTTTNKHGDQVEGASTSVSCKFRYITSVDKQQYQESMLSEAMMWFAPDTNIAEASIVKFEDQYWRIDRLVKARRLSDTTVQFLKAFVNRHSL